MLLPAPPACWSQQQEAAAARAAQKGHVLPRGWDQPEATLPSGSGAEPATVMGCHCQRLMLGMSMKSSCTGQPWKSCSIATGWGVVSCSTVAPRLALGADISAPVGCMQWSRCIACGVPRRGKEARREGAASLQLGQSTLHGGSTP